MLLGGQAAAAAKEAADAAERELLCTLVANFGQVISC